LLLALFLLLLIFEDARAVYSHEWASVTVITVFILLLVTIPTGGAKWLRRVLKDRQSSRPLVDEPPQ
jgi:hypothetical protein